MNLTKKQLEKVPRRDLIRTILNQQRIIEELRQRSLDDFVRQLIESYIDR